ncbi:MAG: hypothetical protein QOI57_3401, partial [Rubrobacteraceae bacterium]|nr:hypothetical protein [Rubrobacteraceae bacterium]
MRRSHFWGCGSSSRAAKRSTINATSGYLAAKKILNADEARSRLIKGGATLGAAATSVQTLSSRYSQKRLMLSSSPLSPLSRPGAR